MRTVQDILFGVTGQTVYFDAPEGRPSSVTSVDVFLWDESDNSAGQSAVGTGSVETNPATTTDAAAGPSQADTTKVPLTATTGCAIGRRYLLTDADSFSEWIEVVNIQSAAHVHARHPLHNDFTTGAAFVSTRIQATVDSTWVADEAYLNNTAGPNPAYRVRWVYVVNSVTYVADTYFNLVRYAGAHGVRPQDVELTSPGWLDRLPVDHRNDQGRRLIDEAYRAVKIDLHQIWTDDAMVANAEIVDELTRWKCIEGTELARIFSGGGSQDAASMAHGAYQARFDALSRITSKVPERSVSGAAQQGQSVGLTRR